LRLAAPLSSIPGESDLVNEAQKKKATQIAAIAGTALLFLVIFGKSLLGVFAPELLMSLRGHSPPAPPAAPPPPAADGSVPPPPPAAPADESAEGAASRALDDVRSEVTPAKVAADPLKALRLVSAVVNDYPDTQAGHAAATIAESIRTGNAVAVGKANANAVEEIARLKESSKAKLEELEHKAVAQEWRDLANRYAGLPAAAQAIAERTRILAEWETIPRADKVAQQKMSLLPKGDDSFEGRGATAIALREFAAVYSATRCGSIADGRADALTNGLVTAVEEKVTEDPEAGLKLAESFREKLATGDWAKRVATAQKKAIAEITRRAQARVAEIRATRNKLDFDKALGMLKGLLPALADQEKTAIEVYRAARENKLPVDAGTFQSGPEGKLKDATVGAFFIDRLEVSNRAFYAYVRETNAQPPRDWNEGAPIDATFDLPVSGVSLADAAGYAKWLGARLPTALEWERAARGTDGRPYPWGTVWNKDALQWLSANLKPCGSFPAGASPVGALDMAGNVAEWTSTTDGDKAAVKGGSRRESVEDAFNMGIVTWVPVNKLDSAIGFRCAWDAK
jgi:formylglycine-generating enzyme required for sulfatase activity